MPDRNEQALSFLLERRSRPAKTLTGPAPADADLKPILTAGLRVPDHGKLEPWHLIVLRGTAPARLGDLCREMSLSRGMAPEQADKAAAMFQKAPLMIAVVAAPVPSEKVPEAEQLMSAGAVCLSLVNAALSAGWGANWLTGWTATDAAFLRAGLDLPAGQIVAGYVVIGTETTAPPERPRPDLQTKVVWLDA